MSTHENHDLAPTPHPDDLRIHVDLSDAASLPMGDLAALGDEFGDYASELMELAEQAITASQGTVTAFVPVDSSGNLLDSSVLYQAKDGLGALGSYRDASGKLAQARWQEVEQAAQTIDPSTALLAAALVQINQKLDRLQESVDRLEQYEHHRDMARIRGDIRALMNDVKDYTYNSQSPMAKTNAHKSALEVRADAEARIVQLRAELDTLAARPKRSLVHTRDDATKRAAAMAECLGEYRLALHAYDYAYFVVVALQENYDAAYLGSVEDELRERDLAYRETYTRCYDAATRFSESAVDGMAGRGLARAASGLGRVIAATPVGDRTAIDETLEGAGGALLTFGAEEHNKIMAQLREEKDTDLRSYTQGLEQLGRLHNNPVVLLADAQTVYLLPVEGDAGADVG